MSSSFTGRRAPNVSQYLANLNTVPSAPELASEISLGDTDLDFLTHAEFFDFDSFHPNAVEYNQHSPQDAEAKGPRMAARGPQYQFGEFQTFPHPVGSSPGANSLQAPYPPQPNHHVGYSGDSRKASVPTNVPSPSDLEDHSRMAAEEDKRRRNTAASARFRVKKKQREQALEKQAKEMTEKVQQLEAKVQQLEMENKWLKGLITDKNDAKSVESLQKEKQSEDRKADEKTDGVGTEEDDA